MSAIHRGQALKGEWAVNPDREMLILGFCLAALARGRSIIEDCPSTLSAQHFTEWLKSNGISCEHKDQAWSIEGGGLTGSFSALQTLPNEAFGRFIALCMLSRDHETVFDFGSDAEQSDLGPLLPKYFQGTWRDGRWNFLEPNLQWKPSPSGDVEHFQRIRLLLQALMHERTLLLEERTTVRDQLSGMLAFFGAPLTVETIGAEEMDELARRMARLQGQKVERKILTKLAPCKVLSGKEIFIPGDPTEAGTIALLASVLPDSEISLRNICLNPGRSGIFNALKRMGANLDAVQKKERYGDQFGTLRVQSCKRLIGRKLTGDLLMTCIEEVPILAVAASLAEGESILRLPEHKAADLHELLEALATNIRLAGVDVGIYEEGLVIRGREEVDANHFDALGHPSVGLAMLALARVAHGQSEVNDQECIEAEFPGLRKKLGVSEE